MATYLDRLKALRKQIRLMYGLKASVEIHASELIRINKNQEYKTIRKTNRINLLKYYCAQLPVIFDSAKVINICLDKKSFTDTKEIQKTAWQRLVQRYDTFLKKEGKDKGIIISDDTDGRTVVNLIRKMRIYNPLPSQYSSQPYNRPTNNIIEDLFQRNSADSYFIQSVDVIAHLLYRKEYPKGSLKKYGVEHLFDLLEPILLKEASKSDTLGIVRK